VIEVISHAGDNSHHPASGNPAGSHTSDPISLWLLSRSEQRILWRTFLRMDIGRNVAVIYKLRDFVAFRTPNTNHISRSIGHWY
jgi:hypothetical protein